MSRKVDECKPLAEGPAWDNTRMTFNDANIFNLPSLVSNMHDPGVSGVECRLMVGQCKLKPYEAHVERVWFQWFQWVQHLWV